MNILKQSTAATIKLGPFIDDTDGKTAETALTIAQADVRLSNNGGDFAQKNSTTSATHDENGYYDIPLDATDTGTLGRLRVAVSKSGALPVWQDFLVVTANVYDTLCSTDSLDVNVTSLADDIITAAKFDESTAFPLKAADTGVTQVARRGSENETLSTLSYTLSSISYDIYNLPTAVWAFTNRTLSSFGTLVSNIWTHATRTLSAFGFTVATNSDANVTAIKVKTDNLPASPAPAGEYDTELAAIQADLNNPDQYKADVSGIPAAVWGYATRTLSSFGTLISDIWAHATRTLSAFGFTVATQSDANVTAIKAKTDNLPTSPAATGDAMTLTAAYDHAKDDVLTPLGVVDGVVDAIKLKTDNIPANPATAGEYTASLAAIQSDVSGIPDAILTKAIVDTLTVEQVLKVLAAVETGITTGGGTDTIVYTGKDGTVIRLTGVDEDGNRSAVIVIPGA